LVDGFLAGAGVVSLVVARAEAADQGDQGEGRGKDRGLEPDGNVHGWILPSWAALPRAIRLHFLLAVATPACKSRAVARLQPDPISSIVATSGLTIDTWDGEGSEVDIMGRVTIRFAGVEQKASFHLKLGPMDQLRPPEREFRGGDEVEVLMTDCIGKPDDVDLVFPDGATAYEVSREFYSVIVSPS
jgi:hypothetical protein